MCFAGKCGCAIRSAAPSFWIWIQEVNVEDVKPVKFAPLMIQGLECLLAGGFQLPESMGVHPDKNCWMLPNNGTSHLEIWMITFGVALWRNGNLHLAMFFRFIAFCGWCFLEFPCWRHKKGVSEKPCAVEGRWRNQNGTSNQSHEINPGFINPKRLLNSGGAIEVYYHYLGGTTLMNRGLFRVGITSNYIKLQETHDFRRRMVKEVGFNKTSGSLPAFLFLHNLDPCNECRRDMFLWIMFAMVKNCLTYSHSGGWSSIHIYPLRGGNWYTPTMRTPTMRWDERPYGFFSKIGLPANDLCLVGFPI